ncbi:MAG: sigma-70 family RNA polymerase sigma factor, partial [Candidatus Hydrogenedentes bacterium]|nr:sigma-70 family RNA polymerase sigma factor [Candidatus Hydrogenedentota bacterium]
MFTIASRRDDKIIAQVLAGYHDQFGLLVQRYLPVVQAIAHARVRNPSDVDDVAQETFLTAFQNLDQLRERGKFPAWLAVITRNSATAILKQRSRDAAIAGTIQSETHIETPDFARRELRSAVRERIEQLDADAREVLLLYYFAGESCREIARILEASEPAVRKRLQRAREALGERILADFRKDDALAALLPERVKHILAAVLASGAAWSKESAAAAIGASAVASGAVLTGGFTLGKSLALAASVIAVAGAAFFVTQQEQAIEPSPVTSQSDSANQQSPVQPDPRNAIADSSADASLAIAMRPTGATIDRQSNASAIVPAPTGILVTGKILHSDGTPVPNATVYGGYWGHEPRREKMETTSDENGAYALYLDKPWEVFLVYGEKEGYARFRSIEVDVPETGAGDVDFTLYREATIEGYIDGRFPVSVAQKPITAFNHDADNILWTVSAESDETGAFTLTGLIPGSYSLAIVAQHDFDPDMENLRIDVHEGDHLTGIEVPYSGDGLVIAGRVTDEDGNPLKGAFVQATGAQGGWNSRYTYTDEEGKYRLVQLDEGEFPLTAHHQKYQYAHAVAEAGSENVDFVLRHHGSVSG